MSFGEGILIAFRIVSCIFNYLCGVTFMGVYLDILAKIQVLVKLQHFY